MHDLQDELPLQTHPLLGQQIWTLPRWKLTIKETQ
jgi:hypothetical protein